METETSVDGRSTGNAVLRGSPHASWAEGQAEGQVVTVDDPDLTLKLLHGNHYDHFVPTAESLERDGRTLRVFRWSHETYIAE
ncbi:MULTISPECIES: DUF5988 family protein [Streptomyces]|uniref:Uncharacterized protein n=1 Tax=Streptomyces tsukubensis (strain DSM 42081 / NBRC 108919 / NRRL 18488 / 9993) TaxID=1114943 RepID=I2MTK3_STRT9|nr:MULTISPECIES: DUF5988 family protein [Streptomyces]AZK92678.1 hypothetical protein B7R87_01275 [Streptomyces tsukubensis]EIF88100.1 hypothetical protein [Streptomyces tsukubensis NRRL18488]MYS68232.1 hypothetical protein [Streptomyces sp. SID5473]QKM71152.1 hypothetical protein STSU_032600 [Streptomyces tsukubensis NRRL18488]TAI40661.1 hypothetical protein EWI31_31605 [Streptomyces tsukubensis]